MTKLQLQEQLGQETKYSKWYLNIIFKAKLENRKKHKKDNPYYIYYENHHILPKSIFLEYENLRINKWNSVLLTPREHILIHVLIWKHYEKLEDLINSRKMGFPLVKILGKNKYTPSKFIKEKSSKVQSSLMNKFNIFKTNNPSENQNHICEYCNKEVTKSAYIRWHSWNCLENPYLITKNRGKKFKLSNPVRFYCKYCNIKLYKNNIDRHNENCLYNPNHPCLDIRIKNNKITHIKCEYCNTWAIPNIYYQNHHINCRKNKKSEKYKKIQQRKYDKEMKSKEIKQKNAKSYAMIDLRTMKTFKSNKNHNHPLIIAKSTKWIYILIYPNNHQVMFMSRQSIYKYNDISTVLSSFIINQTNKGKFIPYNKMKNNLEYQKLTGFESITIKPEEVIKYIENNNVILYK